VHSMRLFFLVFFGFALSFHSYAIEQELHQEAIDSLNFLNELVKKNVENYSYEEKVAINNHVKIIFNHIFIQQQSPVSVTGGHVREGSCCTWHSFDWLDDQSWAQNFLLKMLVINNYTAKGIDDISSCCSGCVFPVISIVLSCFVALGQGLTWTVALPFRCCGTLDIYEDELAVDKAGLEAFLIEASEILLIKKDNI